MARSWASYLVIETSQNYVHPTMWHNLSGSRQASYFHWLTTVLRGRAVGSLADRAGTLRP